MPPILTRVDQLPRLIVFCGVPPIALLLLLAVIISKVAVRETLPAIEITPEILFQVKIKEMRVNYFQKQKHLINFLLKGDK